MKNLMILLTSILLLTSQTSFALENNTEDIQNISEQANFLYAQNQINEAKAKLLSINENDRTAQNWLLIGNILQDQGKIDEAVFMYNKAVQANGNFYKAYYNLGNIYLNDGRPNMAAEQYKKAVKIKPDFAYGHYNLACAYIKLGKFSKARFELYTAIELKNTVPEFHYNLAYVLKQLNKEKEAQKYLEYYNKLTENNYV